MQRSWKLPFWNMPSSFKDDYDMHNGVVCYSYICPLKYHSKCPAQMQMTMGQMSVVLEKKNSHNAEEHSYNHAKGLLKGPQVAVERVEPS